MSREIKRQLRESAQAYQPDHERMAARVQRGTSAPAVRHRSRPRARSGPRAVLVGLAAAVALATGGFAVAAIVHPFPTSGTATHTAMPSPTMPSPSADPATTSTAASSAAAAPAASPSSSPSPSAAASQVQSGPLWSAGSVDAKSTVYWEQNDLALRTAGPLTALTVEVRIALTGRVQQTGSWRTLPSDDFTVTIQQTGNSLDYRWVLKAGRTVPPGQHVFAVQFNHTTGTRSAAGDNYRVDARGPNGAVSVWGGFAGR
ncbi:hypothetical protein [Streptacidiphilus sp. EB129]|uniref:hypothetical protein n=1 Tax=Streptacidiphilus sp. EB129 TaxID=3156262 RepID=UPI0035184B34